MLNISIRLSTINGIRTDFNLGTRGRIPYVFGANLHVCGKTNYVNTYYQRASVFLFFSLSVFLT